MLDLMRVRGRRGSIVFALLGGSSIPVVLGVGSCVLPGQDCEPHADDEPWCQGRFATSCSMREDGNKITQQDCSEMDGGVCRDGRCVLRGERCRGGASEICVDNVAHQCFGDRVLTGGINCSRGEGKHCFERGEGSEQVAFCALSLDPCPAGPSRASCVDGAVVECNSLGFPSSRTECAGEENLCFEAGGKAICTAPVCLGFEGYGPLDLSGSKCDDSALVVCVRGSPEVVACSGDSVCVEVADAAWCAGGGQVTDVRWVGVEGGRFEYRPRPNSSGEPPAALPVELGDFEMLATEVTLGQVLGCQAAGACGNMGSAIPGVPRRHLDFPITATPEVALSFCHWLEADLPTNIEWQYAVRNGGGDQLYPWGDDPPDCSRAVVALEGGGPEQLGCGTKIPQTPCSRSADVSTHGICDLVGNLAERTRPTLVGETSTSGFDFSSPETSLRSVSSSSEPSYPAARTEAELGFRCVRRP